MTDEMFRPVVGSPVRMLLSSRLSRRVDHALVSEDAYGFDVRVWQPAHSSTDRPPFGSHLTLRHAARRRFSQFYQVWLADHVEVMPLPLTDRTGGQWTAHLHTAWRVHDPTTVVRRKTGDAGPAVRRSLRGRVEAYVEARRGDLDELVDGLRVELSGSTRLDDVGVTYRVGSVDIEPENPGRLGLPATGPKHPEPARHEQYAFYRDVVRDGEVALLALWLTHQPDGAKQVLEWVRAHPPPLGPEDRLNGALSDLFAGLEDWERSEVALAAARVLARTGNERAEALLRRFGYAADGDERDDPDAGFVSGSDSADAEPAAACDGQPYAEAGGGVGADHV